jgi:hypothetical protein
MSNVMDVNAIMELEANHYGAGQYEFTVATAETIETQNGRPGVKLRFRIEDTAVLKGDQAPLGESMFKNFYFPMESDKQKSAEFMARLVQSFLKGVDVQSHPDYAQASATGIASQAFWDLTIGAHFEAKVTWDNKKEKVTDEATGKVTYVKTEDMEQDITKFKPIS